MNPEKKYLDLLKKTLLNELYLDNELRIFCLAKGLLYKSKLLKREISFEKLHHVEHYFPEKMERLKHERLVGKHLEDDLNHLVYAHSMIGRKRLENIEFCLDKIRVEQIEGDVIECGVWRGGATIFMQGYLDIYGMKARNVWVADSFEGLPKPTLAQERKLDISKDVIPGLAVTKDDVENNFKKYDLLDHNVKFVKGWFKDSLPYAPIEKLALLRLDGDLYESTMDALNALYHKVVANGYVVVDDYGILPQCSEAVNDFRAKHNITDTIHKIDHSGIYWVKS